MKPIGPEPGRVWPPANCYMDEDGNWWEGPSIPLTIRADAVDFTIENANFSSNNGSGIHIPCGVKTIEITDAVYVETPASHDQHDSGCNEASAKDN